MSEFAASLAVRLFGGDTPEFPLLPGQVAARAVLVYIAGVAIVRLGKSRLISRASPLDVILGFILGSLLSRGITGHAAMSDTLVASAALVGVHWFFTAFACRSKRFEALIKGHVYPLVEQGDMRRENMRHSHVSEDDLHEALRLNGLEDLGQVHLACKERSGEVSIIKRTNRS